MEGSKGPLLVVAVLALVLAVAAAIAVPILGAEGPAPSLGPLSAISCASSTTCLAVGFNGSTNGPAFGALVSRDGGAHWSAVTVPLDQLGNLHTACWDGRHCPSAG